MQRAETQTEKAEVADGKGFKRCPVDLGEELEVEITGLRPKWEGVARNQGFVIYFADAKPGERVKIKITRLTKMAIRTLETVIDSFYACPMFLL